MKRSANSFLFGLLTLALCCLTVWAQGSTAQISGIIKDQSGAVMPGVEISATQTETGIVRTTITNETGSYVLPNLAIGPYRLEAALPGFRTFVQTGIVLQVNSNPVINAALVVGQVAERVEVQANAAMVETRNSGVGQVIESERILELPLNARQATDLLVLGGAAVQTGVATSRGMQGGVAISVGGGQSFGVAYLLDGALHNNPYDSLNLPLPFPDALLEFKVETSALSAQNGMHSGASVNAVTKSGTNQFHGSLFEFVRNYKFNARDYFALARDTLKRNQFGGTLGGPIVENKVFFFGGYQGTRTRQEASDNFRFVPTAAMLAGDFTAFASPVCNAGQQISLRTPFLNNRVDPAQFSKAALNIAAKLPKPQDECGKITYGLANRPNESQFVGKIDYQRSTNHSLFGRYMATTYYAPPPYLFSDDVLTTTVGGRDNLAQSLTFGNTYLISASIVNSLRLAVSRTPIHRTNTDFFSAPDVGIAIHSYLPKYMILSVTGGFNLGGGTEVESKIATNTFQVAEDLSIVRGTHQMSFGLNVSMWNMRQVGNVGSPGPLTINGQTTGLGLADFLTGKLSSFEQRAPTRTLWHQWYAGIYGQDSWKVTPRLTLNYGVRWEPWFPMQFTEGRAYNFDYDRFRQGIRSTVFTNAPPGLYYPGDPGFPGKSGMYKKWLDLGPRAGLAWDPRGDGRMSIRASYGIAYDFVNGMFHINTTSAPPWVSRIVLNTPVGGLDNPWLGYPGGNPHPLGPLSKDAFFPAGGQYLTSKYDTQTTSVQSWNLSVQRQIAADWLISASYIGSGSRHLWSTRALNPAIYFPGGSCTINGVTYPTCSTTTNTDQRRRFSLERPEPVVYLSAVDEYDDGGTGSYHGLLLSVQRRAGRGVSIGGNYTWSHCITDPTAGGGTPNTGGGFLDPNNRALERGNCDSDRRHNFNLTGVAETPQFTSPTMRALGTGWRLSGIFRKASGSYLTITGGLDRALTGIGGQRPNQLLANPYGDKSLKNYLNPLAFTQPPAGTLGNVGVANVSGPGTWQFDAALSRVFRFHETQRLEFRADAFNVTNSFRPGNPGTSLNQTNTFGQINSSREARIMQFALRYVF